MRGEELLILPSNVIARSHPKNTSSRYTTVLQLPLETTPTTRVGLLEIQFPLTFYNVERDFYIRINKNNGETITVYLLEGVYEEIDSFRDMMNQVLKEYNCTCKANPNGKLSISIDASIDSIALHPKLKRIMGMVSPWGDENRLMEGTWSFDPWINHRIIFVSADFVKPSQLNQESRQILQSVILPLKLNFGDTFSRVFTILDWLHFEGENRSCVTVSLTDTFNDPIKFRSGSVLVKLLISS